MEILEIRRKDGGYQLRILEKEGHFPKRLAVNWLAMTGVDPLKSAKGARNWDLIGTIFFCLSFFSLFMTLVPSFSSGKESGAYFPSSFFLIISITSFPLFLASRRSQRKEEAVANEFFEALEYLCSAYPNQDNLTIDDLAHKKISDLENVAHQKLLEAARETKKNDGGIASEPFNWFYSLMTKLGLVNHGRSYYFNFE